MAAKPNDTTGRIREEAAKANAEEQQARAAEMTMATAQKQIARETEVVDLTTPKTPTVVVEETTVVAAGEQTETVRILEDIDNMVYGAGNYLSFKAGQKYKISRELANHLRDKKYVADV